MKFRPIFCEILNLISTLISNSLSTCFLINQVPEAVEDNLMFNGEVEHVESPPSEQQTTPTKMITEEPEDSKPSTADTPSDPQVNTH